MVELPNKPLKITAPESALNRVIEALPVLPAMDGEIITPMHQELRELMVKIAMLEVKYPEPRRRSAVQNYIFSSEGSK